MGTVLYVIACIFAAIGVVFVFACASITFQYISYFKWRYCKHCNHRMQYKGLRDDDKNGHYLFHCKHCGAWEQVPRENFFRCDD